MEGDFEPENGTSVENQIQGEIDETVETDSETDLEDLSFLDGLDDDSGEINDDAIRSNTVPKSRELYKMHEQDKDDKRIEIPTLKDFQQFSHQESISQGLFARLVHFSLGSHENEVAARTAFVKFCQRNHVSRELAEKIVGFRNQAVKERRKELEQIQLNTAKSGNRPTASKAAQISKILSHPAYTDRLNPDHKNLVRRLLVLTGAIQ